MEVIITEWAKQTYLELRGKVFIRDEYKNRLRPDVELLKTSYPTDPKFSNDKFWGPATLNGNILKHGYKMKWHNFGNGNVQLRLGVVIAETELSGEKKERAFLCRSYIKNDKTEKREMAKLKIHIKKIIDGNYYYRGQL